MKSFTKLIAAGAAAVSTVVAAHAAPIKTDVVFIVDETGSMGNVQANVRNNIGLFSSILAAGGVDARFALVGFGYTGGTTADRLRILTDFTDATGFAAAAQNLAAFGGPEHGHSATAFALGQLDGQTDFLSYGIGIKNLIIVSDDDSNTDGAYSVGGNTATESIIDQLLSDANALYNGILNPGSSAADYDDAIANNGGSIFNLSTFNTTDQTVIEQFVTDFANTKLQETLDFCALNPTDPACTGGEPVSEPGMIGLFGLGLMGLGVAAIRRRYAL